MGTNKKGKKIFIGNKVFQKADILRKDQKKTCLTYISVKHTM